jgi:diguanylate cyclase (GGDEF)-like protein/PAS domain S-box-containing protein
MEGNDQTMNDIHILFVDDEADILSAVKRMMTKESYSVHFAQNGADALNIMAETPIHVIVSDMRMPEMDGLTLIRHVKERHPDTVRMALSADIKANSLLHCINTGEIFRYITKPAEPGELRQAIRDGVEYFLVRKDRIDLVHQLEEKNEKLMQLLAQEQNIKLQLRMNQAALESQNENLRVMKAELQLSKERYFDLYDLAPVGYCTISDQGAIQETNLTAATLLGMTRSELIDQPFSRFIVDADQEIYANYWYRLFQNGKLPTCDLRIVKMNETHLWVHLTATLSQDAEGHPIRLVMSDITDSKLAQKALEEVNQKLEALSNIDGLTGIPNRRHFNERLMFEYDRLSRSRGELSIILIDIDHFKDYNDCYGHVAGDDCLRHVARAIEKGMSRSADFCARYGGEEFICILPETGRDGADLIAERIRCNVEELGIKHKKSKTAKFVTISSGVATIRHSPYETAVDCVNKADNALYLSKKNGRNRITHFPTDIASSPSR